MAFQPHPERGLIKSPPPPSRWTLHLYDQIQEITHHNLEQAQVLFKVYQTALDGSLDDLQARQEVIEIIREFIGIGPEEE